MELGLSASCVARLLEGEETYEVLSIRAFKFRVGKICSLYGIPDASAKVLSSEVMNVSRIPNEVWDSIAPKCGREAYVTERCGKSAWMLNSRVYVLRLKPIIGEYRIVDERGDRSSFVRKFWLRGTRDEGAFISKSSEVEISGELADSRPYCELCDEHGDKYRDFLCEAYGIEREKLPTLKGWLNRKCTQGRYLPRRVNVTSGKFCRVREITDEEWLLFGVDVNEDKNFKKRIAIVDRDYWDRNFHVRLYKYKLISNYIFDNEEDGKEVDKDRK